MSKSNVETVTSTTDRIKLGLAVLVIAAGIVGYSLPEDKEMVLPGDNVSMTVRLIAPIAMEEGLRFAIREGGRTVGAGVVAKIIK